MARARNYQNQKCTFVTTQKSDNFELPDLNQTTTIKQ